MNLRCCVLFGSLFWLLAEPGDVQAERITTVERRWWLMGTLLEISLEGADRAALLQASESVFAAVKKTENMLSIWQQESDLSRLNNSPPGTPVTLPAPVALCGERPAGV